MKNSLTKMLTGYQRFREQYALGHHSMMQHLAHYGQQPQTMLIACCDSRVDPALILQCHPGDLFVVRNIANIVPPYEQDAGYHGTSAALEYGICFLQVKHLIILGHSQCGGIQALLNKENSQPNDFITHWVSLIKDEHFTSKNPDECAKHAVQKSYQNCLTFPWIQAKVTQKILMIHRWFFDIKTGQIFRYSDTDQKYKALDS
jgi:carbonic anhydrase